MTGYTIVSSADWVTLRPEAIVDPMIYRVGELFLAGAGEGGQADRLWDAVSKDVGGLVSFFDLLVLHDRLPAFNYAVTFPGGFDVGDPVFDVVNSRVEIIDQVDVGPPAYFETKEAALDTLRRAGDGSAELLPPGLRDDLTQELSTLEYRWNPSLGPLEERYAGPARTAASFLLGTLVFSAYAQQTGAPHVMSPKRSRLFTASALSAPRGSPEAEAALYTELARRFRDAGDG